MATTDIPPWVMEEVAARNTRAVHLRVTPRSDAARNRFLDTIDFADWTYRVAFPSFDGVVWVAYGVLLVPIDPETMISRKPEED